MNSRVTIVFLELPSNPICEGAIGVITETIGRLVAETSIDHITSVTKQLSIEPKQFPCLQQSSPLHCSEC